MRSWFFFETTQVPAALSTSTVAGLPPTKTLTRMPASA